MPFSKDKRLPSHPLHTDKDKLKSLWQTVFQDSEEFANLFFNRVYRPENTLIIRKEDSIVSALQMIPYSMKIADRIIPSAYVCGVCTLTLERGKGLMNILINEAMEIMRQKGYCVSILIPAQPWLFDFYKRFGYTHPINYSIESYHINKDATTPSNYTYIPYTTRYYPFFDKKQCERQNAVLHDVHDMKNIIQDLINDNGNAWIALEEDTPVGIALAKPVSKNTVVVKEILCNNTQIKESLINNILNIYNAQTAEVRVPANTEKVYPYGLACVLDKSIVDISDIYMASMLD